MARRAACSAVTWAAKGVLLREPLKPCPPAEPQAITLPWVSVRLTIVLLKVDRMCACPTAMFLRSRRRVLTTFFFLPIGSSGHSMTPAARASPPGFRPRPELAPNRGDPGGTSPRALLLLATHAHRLLGP